jgi:Transcriptional regulator
MRLTQVRDFVAVVEAGSLSAAARNLGVSQPGLTKSIASLEAELNVALLQRTPRGVALTRFGRAFYARARAAHSELEKARHEVLQLAGVRTGQVAVGFGPMAAALMLPAAVLKFQAFYPDVEVRLLEGFAHAVIPLVRDETLDMAIGPRLPGAQTDPALHFRPVFVNDQIVVARKGHPLAEARSIDDLSEARWLSFEPRAVVGRVLAALGLPESHKLMQCESLNVLVALLASSDLLAIASTRILTLPQSGDALREVRIVERIKPMTTGLYTRAGAPLTKPAAAMARVLVETGRALMAT